MTDQGAMQGGQGVYSDPWSSPVSTVNTVNTVTSLLKNGQTIFNQDWNTVPINSYGTVSILFIVFFFLNSILKKVENTQSRVFVYTRHDIERMTDNIKLAVGETARRGCLCDEVGLLEVVSSS